MKIEINPIRGPASTGGKRGAPLFPPVLDN